MNSLLFCNVTKTCTPRMGVEFQQICSLRTSTKPDRYEALEYVYKIGKSIYTLHLPRSLFHLLNVPLYVAINWSVTVAKRSFHLDLVFHSCSVSNSLFSSTALVQADQYFKWLCKVDLTQFVFSMFLMLYLPGQMSATSQGSSKFSSTARRLVRAVYLRSMWWPHWNIFKAVLR